MPIGILFWVLMVCWIVFAGYRDTRAGPLGPAFGGNLLLFILLSLLGWRLFGPVIQ